MTTADTEVSAVACWDGIVDFVKVLLTFDNCDGIMRERKGHEPEEVCIKWSGGGWYHATRLEDWMVIPKWF